MGDHWRNSGNSPRGSDSSGSNVRYAVLGGLLLNIVKAIMQVSTITVLAILFGFIAATTVFVAPKVLHLTFAPGVHCMFPEDIDARGNRCGKRSAYSRKGGVEPKAGE